MDPVEAYLAELSAIRGSGAAVPETSGYGALANLLNAVGHTLKPKVRCLINLTNTGAGIPDGGLFVTSQFAKGVGEPLPGQLPARGAIEVKPASASAKLVAQSEQVMKYLEKYRQVLVTTYREFVLVGNDADGARATLESFSLAATETAFWVMSTTPRKAAHEQGARLTDFLRRALLRQAPIAAPQDLAWFLASYAREARARVEERVELPALAVTRSALEESLGMTFQGERGEHFFRSTLVQTLFYGLFAAWVFWSEHHDYADNQARFRWREAAQYLRIPILQKLFWDFANPTQLGALKLDEVLDWAAEALNRVDRVSFFATFEAQHAVQYFYEPFLEAFDPELRKQLGVWYTPPEIVKYMVARVDQVLRSELDIADGLADPRVVVLDPCCGTGAYLVEVLNTIAATLREKGGDGLLAHDLKQAAMSRIFGFEILPAPFVISHLQIGMLLHRLGAPLADESNERAGVYLTNALTGWEPPAEPKQHLLFTEMEEERDKAEAVKQHQPILVILGNPPYNGFAGLAVDEERDLVGAYRRVDKVAAPQGQGLNDLYVRFFRMAERRITEGQPGKGIVCFISNYSWLDGLSFTGMRERFLNAFDDISIDCLNGDKYKTGKLTPDGEPDPSVFSTEKNREGIQVGTAISMLVRKRDHGPASAVAFRQFWGKTKLAALADASEDAEPYATVRPGLPMGLTFMPAVVSPSYHAWPSLPHLFPISFPGVKTSRDAFLIDIDRERLVQRMSQYFDSEVSDQEMANLAPAAMASAGRFNARETRRKLLHRGLQPERIMRYCYRPMDNRWLYWDTGAGLLDRPREEYVPHIFTDNIWLEARQKQTMDRFDRGFVTQLLGDNMGNGLSSYFPIYLSRAPGGVSPLASGSAHRLSNLTPMSSAYLDQVRANEFELLCHIAGLLHAPAYRTENAGALRQDWPRVPLPASPEVFRESADLGLDVGHLLDVESPVDRVTVGNIRYELRLLGAIARVGGSQVNPDAGDLSVTAGWGHAGQGGVTMPARGRFVERAYADSEIAAFREGVADLDFTIDQLMTCLGNTCVDVYLNDLAYWRCVPKRVWTYTIGGYQVIKKWLSYRERPLLDRDLTVDEARYVMEMARRIAAILLLEPALDANYAAVKADTYPWQGSGVDSRQTANRAEP